MIKINNSMSYEEQTNNIEHRIEEELNNIYQESLKGNDCKLVRKRKR